MHQQALQKLECYSGYVTRGEDIYPGSMEKLHVGNVLCSPAFWSASFRRTPSYYTDKPLQYIIESKTGRKIQSIAAGWQEYEILYRCQQPFYVNDVTKYRGKTVVLLTELPQEYKQLKTIKLERKLFERNHFEILDKAEEQKELNLFENDFEGH
ncbi:unnamed protein product [Didymodactylos carnosus]|uniref:NAD(P)(+)--arginine ADP-ribosyltransferase n=1 Tax=Didymodactylos carnosus TaxID=1234261 RepID=A0A815QNI4_9BILA|nr:unnamed protein product [Didymodactylos carnosus]CAF4335006.1 unnamed protein product [Didymodactylos carnosus]